MTLNYFNIKWFVPKKKECRSTGANYQQPTNRVFAGYQIREGRKHTIA